MTGVPALASIPAEERDARIVDLCDRAIADLREARDIEEVRRIGALAEAVAAYARKMKAALSAQNRAMLVVALAEGRIGAELVAARERDEIAKRGDNRHTRQDVGAGDIYRPSLRDIKLSRDRAAQATRLAAVTPERIERMVADATEAGVRVSKTMLLQAIDEEVARAPKSPPRFVPQPRNAPPEAIAAAIQMCGVLRELAQYCERYPADRVARGMSDHHREDVPGWLAAFDRWRAALSSALGQEV